MRGAPFLALLLALLLSCGGCWQRHITADVELPSFPFKVGILADAHLTTLDGEAAPPLRGLGEDLAPAFARRPIALEDGLSEHALRVMIQALRARGVDVILFLGDALNSGEADRAEDFFRVLREERGEDERRLPIFVTIGRHDFLAAGVSSDPETRRALVAAGESKNRPLAKFEYLEMVHRFNAESADARFRYEDNFAALERERHRWVFEGGRGAARQGLYLAGRVTYTGAVEAEIFLADSSDFKDSGFDEPALTPRARVQPSRGSISTDSREAEGFESQVDYLARLSANTRARFRLIAAHDSPLDMIMGPPADALGLRALVNPMWSGRVRRGLEDWLLEDGASYWLCARGEAGQDNFGIGWCRTIGLRQVEVGSVTDAPQGAVIVGPVREDLPEELDAYLAYRELPLRALIDDGATRALIQRLQAAPTRSFPRVNRLTGLARFGLDRSFSTRSWDARDNDRARANLAAFIEAELAPYKSQADATRLAEAEEQLKTQLAFIAGLKGGVRGTRDPFARFLREAAPAKKNLN